MIGNRAEYNSRPKTARQIGRNEENAAPRSNKPQSASFVFREVDFDPNSKSILDESFDSMKCCCSDNEINIERKRNQCARDNTANRGKEQTKEMKLSLSFHDLFNEYEDVADYDKSVVNLFLSKSQCSKDVRTGQQQDNQSHDVQNRTKRNQHLPDIRKEQMNMLPKHLQSLLSALHAAKYRC